MSGVSLEAMRSEEDHLAKHREAVSEACERLEAVALIFNGVLGYPHRLEGILPRDPALIYPGTQVDTQGFLRIMDTRELMAQHSAASKAFRLTHASVLDHHICGSCDMGMSRKNGTPVFPALGIDRYEKIRMFIPHRRGKLNIKEDAGVHQLPFWACHRESRALTAYFLYGRQEEVHFLGINRRAIVTRRLVPRTVEAFRRP